jgi:hypothetical protein
MRFHTASAHKDQTLSKLNFSLKVHWGPSPVSINETKENKMIISPDDTYSAREAAEFLRKSERQVQRYLTTGKLSGERPNGRWQITALALWKFQGIEQEMKDIWVAYCIGMSKNDAQ